MIDNWTFRIRDLSLQYRGSSVPALQCVSATIGRGEITAIIGETGSGKSTLVRIALGLLASGATTDGTIDVRPDGVESVRPLELDRKAARAFRRRSIGYIPQLTQRALVPVLTVRQHFAQFDEKASCDPRSVGERAISAMERIGLHQPERVLQHYPHQLSGGMAQRVCIALAMFGAPPIVVADEPTSGLDAIVRRRVADLLESEMAGSERTMLLVTHDLALARRLATNVVVLYRGQLLESTPASEFFTAPKHPYSRHLLASIPAPGRPLPEPFDSSKIPSEVAS